MTGFPRYGNNRREQAKTLAKLYDYLEWRVIVPGHGHVRDYTRQDLASVSVDGSENPSKESDIRWTELQDAIRELESW